MGSHGHLRLNTKGTWTGLEKIINTAMQEEKRRSLREGKPQSGIQDPVAFLHQRFHSKLRFVLHLNFVARYHHGQDRYSFSLEKPVRVQKIRWVVGCPAKEICCTNLRPRQDRAPPLNGRKASRGQSPRNLSGLNACGSSQYLARKHSNAILAVWCVGSTRTLTVVMEGGYMDPDV